MVNNSGDTLNYSLDLLRKYYDISFYYYNISNGLSINYKDDYARIEVRECT